MDLAILLLAMVGLSACASREGVQNTGDSRPNIVLIMADDVTFSHWGCYGGSVPTPNIDKIAEQGMLFTRAFTPSAACTPSRFSVMTGQYPGRCIDPGFLAETPRGRPYSIGWNTPITEENLTLHEVLKQAGYYTGYVGKFHIGSLDFDKPEHNPDIPVIPPELSPDSMEADSLLAAYQRVIADRVRQLTGADFTASVLWENSDELPLPAVRKHNLEWITRGGMEFLNSTTSGQPFFLHFNTTALHGPNHYDNLKTEARFSPEGRLAEPYQYHPPRNAIFARLDSLGIARGDTLPDYINHYNAGILYLDDQVGILMNRLEEMGLAENTLVILTADHNIEPGKSTIYDRGVNVPFLLKWPEKAKAGSRCSEMVSFVDFLPTFARLAGVETEGGVRHDGIDFSPVLEGKPLGGREFLYFEEGYTRGVRDDRFKYIAMRFPQEITAKLQSGEQKAITHMGRELHGFGYIAQEYHPGYFDADQLYDLEQGPYEQKNLAHDPAYADQLQRCREALQAHLAGFRHPFPLADTAYTNLPEYRQAIQNVKERGTAFIPWWNRKLDYPPSGRQKPYK